MANYYFTKEGVYTDEPCVEAPTVHPITGHVRFYGSTFAPQWERDGKTAFHGPACSCSSRNQQRWTPGHWHCNACGRDNFYRMTADGYLPFSRETAEALDAERARMWK